MTISRKLAASDIANLSLNVIHSLFERRLLDIAIGHAHAAG